MSTLSEWSAMENMGKTQHTGMSTWDNHIKLALGEQNVIRYIESYSRISKSFPKKSQYMDNTTREEAKTESWPNNINKEDDLVFEQVTETCH